MGLLKMNKKGGIGLVFAIIIILAFVALLIVGINVAIKKGLFEKEEEEPPVPIIELFLKAKDAKTNQYLDASYMVESENSIVAKGKLSADALTPVKLNNQKEHNIFCSKEGYYSNKIKKEFSIKERRSNKSKQECSIIKTGYLHVQHSGNLLDQETIIKLNLTAINGAFQKLGLCFGWTAGIVRVEKRNDVVYCEFGTWKNWSMYFPENKTYTFLPENYYRCGKDLIEKCESTIANRCNAFKDIPEQYKNKVDSCSYLGTTLQSDQSIQITIDVDTLEFKNELDYLDIYIFDKDLRWNSEESLWLYTTDYEGDDVAAPQLKYRISYKEN